MKRYIVLLISVLFMVACSDSQFDKGHDKTVQIRTQPTQPSNVIMMNEAMAKIKAFEDSETNPLAARSGFINLENLKDYIEFAEAEMAALDKDMTGVEIYLGRYLDAEAGHHYEGQLSFIFFPTCEINGTDIPYDFSNQMTVREVYDDYINGKNVDQPGVSSAMNKSNMSPPRMPN